MKNYGLTSDIRPSTRYPEWRCVLVERLRLALSSDIGAKLAFERKLSAYFCGELPHCKETITCMLLCLLDQSTINEHCYKGVDGFNTIPRVSYPWPVRTKEALRVSLDNGVFDDFELATATNQAKTMHLSTVVMDEGVGSSLWQCMSPNSHAKTL